MNTGITRPGEFTRPNALAMSRRTMLRAIGLGGGATLLAACAPSGGGQEGGAPTSGGGGAATEDFSFASWSLTEETPQAVIEANINAFADQADVTVNTVSYPYGEYLNQLMLQIRGGQFSGAVQLDIAWLGTLAALGRLQDLGELAEGRGYAESALVAGRYDGVQYGLPWTMGAIGLVANSDMLDSIGADAVPETIEDFTEMLRELRSLDVIPYAASTKVGQLKDVQVWMQTFGSPLLDDGRVSITDDGAIEALAWYKDLYDEGLIAADVDRFDARSLFAQGQAALYDDAPVGRAPVVADSPDPDLADKLLPAARPVINAGDTPRALAWGHTVVVVDGDGAGTAGEFAQWLTSDEEVVVDYFNQLGLPPTTEVGLASDEVTNDEFVRHFTERITATATPSPLWTFSNYGQIDAVIAEHIQAVLIGRQTPAEAMAEAQEAADELTR